MGRTLLRTVGWTAPALAIYFGLAPMAGMAVDHRLGWDWQLPALVALIVSAFMMIGASAAFWAVWLFSIKGCGTPNPMCPPRNLVTSGPFRYTRNPIMLGCWLIGFGLAILLRSPSLFFIYSAIALAGCIYVRQVEERRLLERFGDSYRQYLRTVPRWLVVGVALIAAVGSIRAETAAAPVPAVLVQIKCKPGGSDRWKKVFEEQIAPSIQEAIEKGDEITRFAYFETILAGQPYDFILILQAKSFAFFDKPRAYPHYKALFRRIGQQQGEKVLEEMTSWEQFVSITLLRAYQGDK